MDRTPGGRIAVRAISLLALLVSATGGAITASGGVAAASSSSGVPGAHTKFQPVQADEAFAKSRGAGYQAALATARKQSAAIPRAASPAIAAQKNWTALGPEPENNPNFSYGGPNSGRITGLALTPTGTIYAASAGGGVWTSTNDGAAWTTTTDSQPDIAMGAVAVDPSNANYVFAGTGEDNACLDCFYGAGVLESSNGGATWTTSNPSNQFSGADISSIVVLPAAASIASTVVLAGTTNGLYISTDGGSSWTRKVGSGWTSGNVTSIVVNPLTTPGISIYAFVAGVGLEESTDGGATWSPIGSFSSGTNGALAIAPNAAASATTLYLSLGSNSGYLGMSKSTDGGATWSAVSAPFYTGQDYSYDGSSTGDTGDQSWYDNAIAIDPTNPNIVVAGGITAVETTDGGASWTNLDGVCFFCNGVKQFHPDFHAVVFDNAGDLYIGNDGGVWKLPAADVNTTPPTTAFRNLNSNLDITQFYAGPAQSGNASQILGGAQDNGTNLYSASASTPTTWNEVDSGDGGFAAIDPANPLIQYSEADISVGGTLDRTENGWTSFSAAGFTQLPPPFSQANWAPPLVTVPGTVTANGGTFSTVLIGADSVHQSVNGGVSWTVLGQSTSHHGTGPGSDVSAIAVAPSNPSVIYAGFDDGTVQMSSDGGATWTILTSIPTASLDITHITVSASDPFTIYVSLATTYNGFSYTASGPKVLVGSALNVTPTWTDVTSGLPSGVPTNSVISDGASGLIVADDTGVYWAQTLNGASTVWTRVGSALPNVQVMDVLLTPGGILIATTHGRGAWAFPFSTAADGSGTMSVSPTSVGAGSTGNTETFTYTAATGGTSGGEIDVTVPTGWSPPSTTGSAAGFTTSGCGAVGLASRTITVTGVTLGSGATCSVVYGSKASGGTGASAPGSAGVSTFATSERSSSFGVVTALASSPTVTVTNAADGSGTMTVTPTSVRAGSAGDTLNFTYTAAAGGLSSGEIDVAVPDGWSAPSTTGTDPGYTTAVGCGTVSPSGTSIAVTGVTLAGGATCSVVYGSKSLGGTGASAPGSGGLSTFTTSEKSTTSGTVTGLAVSPTVTVTNAPDGSGTLTVSPTSVLAGSTGNTLTFTYTAAAGGTNSGEIDVTVPSGWSAPSTTGTDPGYTTSGCGTVGLSGLTITVTGVTLTSGATCTIVYGSTASGGSGASAPGSGGTSTFTTTEKSTASGTLTGLAVSPVVAVGNAGDGSGTLTVSPTSVLAGSTGDTLTFTYTAAAGGVNSGEIDLSVPAGWSSPSTTGSAAGFTTSGCGTVGASGSALTVTGVTLSSAATCTIVYGSMASGGPGASAPGSAATSTFDASDKSTGSGTVTGLAVSPAVTVTNAPDGSGTLIVSPTSLLAGSTGNTLTFTYTAAAGGTSSGEIDVAVPSGWSAPSTTGTDAGYTSSTCGTVGLSGGTITVTGVTLVSGATCTIVYGSRTSGGPGASAPASAAISTFATSEKSTGSGTVTGLAVSPAVTVNNAPDGSGTLTVSPTSVLAGSTGDTLTFTYTAATGGTSSGEIDVVVPAGWSAPSTTGTDAGYTTSTCGAVGASGSTLAVTGVTLTSGATCAVILGDKSAGGPGVHAPSSSGLSTFDATEKSTASGTLMALFASPAVTVANAADGTGTLTVLPTSVLAGSTGDTLTFTYTAAAGGTSSGEIDVAVPAGWSAPSMTGTDAGYTTSTCGTVGTSGSSIAVTAVTLTSGATCTIVYGSTAAGGSGASVPGSGGTSTFTTDEKSTSSGTLTALAVSPSVAVSNAPDGSGSLTVSPTSVLAGSTGDTLTFTYTAAAGGTSDGEIDVAVPAGWSAPSTTGTDAGYTSSTCGTVGAFGSTIAVAGVTLTSGATCSIVYGSTASGGTGASAPGSAGLSTFDTTEKSTASGTLMALFASPAVTVANAADGTGTLTVLPTSVLAGSTGDTLTFTYTAATGGTSNGEIDMAVPAGWSAPSTTGTDAGYTTSNCGTVGVSGSSIAVTGVTLTSGATCTIVYGSTGSGGSGASAPGSAGPSTFIASEKSTSSGTLTALMISPSVTVGSAADGTGTLTVLPTSVLAGSTGDTLTFTYTAAAGGISSGEIDVAVPGGWSAPSTTGTDPGYATSDCGTVGASGSTIAVTGVTLTSGATCSIVYGSTASGGTGASAPPSAGLSTFDTTEMSTASGTLTGLAVSPAVTVSNAADGTGTLTVSPTAAVAGSTGQTLTFTYTAAAGGTNSGEIDVAVPAGWSAPSTTGTDAGYTTSDCGTVGASGSTIAVTGVTLTSGATCSIVYGSTASGGTGASAPPSSGLSTFDTTEMSTASGTSTGLAVSPAVTVTNAADGTGTLTVSPTSVLAGSTGDTLTFTYTAAAGGISGGEIDVAVPSGWSAPSTTGTDPGYATSDCGTVGASGSTIAVTGVTLTSGATCSIVYGSTASGGTGASAPGSAGLSTFDTTEMSTASGTLTGLAVSPAVTVSNAADGTGTMTVLPTSVLAGSTGDTLTFTYTAAAGGTSSGEIDVAVPAGWSAPSMTGTDAGYTTSTCGTVGASGSTIAVTGVTLTSGATCTVTYGDTSAAGPGADSPAIRDVSTFSTTEKSTPSGALTALAASPSVTTNNAADGTGTMTVVPSTVLAGSTGQSLTFTYTSAAGGTSDGEIDVAVPTGWSAPSTTGSAAGYTTSNCGVVGISGRTITVTVVTLTSGLSCGIVYGSKGGGGPGATAPSATGTSTFSSSERSTASGTLTALAISPGVTVTNASDGTGTFTVLPTSVSAKSTGHMLTFTYTAATGGTSNGGIDVAVPTGWSAPSTTGSAAGFTTSTCGTVGVAGTTIAVTGVSLTGGATCTVTFGDKSATGPGATAPSAPGVQPFTTTEKSTAAGTLTALVVSPTVAVNSNPTTTSVSVSPNSATQGHSVTFSATVHAPWGTPTGTVTFTTGSTSLCAAALKPSGTGSCVAADAPIGTDTITGTYSGDAADSSSSGVASLTVANPAPAPGHREGYWLVARDGGVFYFGDAKFHGSTGNVHLNQPIVGMAADPATGGYWLVARDGGVFNFDAPFLGSTGNVHLNQPIVGMAATKDGKGYWLVAADGGVFYFGDAKFHGSTGNVHLNQPIVGMAADPATGGYWLVARDGGVFNFDAPFLGSTGNVHLNQPIVGMAATKDGKGYWLVAADGGVFYFGDAKFHGSTGNVHLNQPIVGMAADPATGGYWLVARDGGVFNFDAPFLGSTGNMHLNQPIVGMAADPATGGYWLMARDGGVFNFDAPFLGSTGNVHLNQPIVGMAADPATRGYWLVARDGGVFNFDAPFLGSTGNVHLNQPIVGMATGDQY